MTLGALLAAAAPLDAISQYPNKAIRVIVPFPPGPIDLTVRIIQPRISEDLGQPLVIDNRPGANGFIGSDLVAHTAPDGYTLLASSASPLVSGAVLSKYVPFDPVRDFTPITTLTRSVNLLVVRDSVPVDSVRGLIDYARRNPGKLYYGSTGIGSIQHLDAEGFKLAAGLDIVHVPSEQTARLQSQLHIQLE